MEQTLIFCHIIFREKTRKYFPFLSKAFDRARSEYYAPKLRSIPNPLEYMESVQVNKQSRNVSDFSLLLCKSSLPSKSDCKNWLIR